jgi:hypothetical protein
MLLNLTMVFLIAKNNNQQRQLTKYYHTMCALYQRRVQDRQAPHSWMQVLTHQLVALVLALHYVDTPCEAFLG